MSELTVTKYIACKALKYRPFHSTCQICVFKLRSYCFFVKVQSILKQKYFWHLFPFLLTLRLTYLYNKIMNPFLIKIQKISTANTKPANNWHIIKIMTLTAIMLQPVAQYGFAGAPPSRNILLGKFEPRNDSNFVPIASEYCDKAEMYIQRETYDAYLRMRKDAEKEGIDLTIVSATRNYKSQSAIWNRKWNSLSGNDSTKVCSIMRYSSMPGTSRHHWGTDIDFISVEPEYWKNGEGLRIYNWLRENAPRYGFFQPYTDDPKRTGYDEERWHWSYAILSIPYLEEYIRTVSPVDISGFSGSQLVEPFKIIETYVSGITPYPWREIAPTF